MSKRLIKRDSAASAKPLLGMGPVGWALLAVALALAVVFFSGYDLRHQLLRAITWAFGGHAASWTVAYVLGPYSVQTVMFFPAPEFGLVAMCLVLIAMQVHPRRLRWWWYAVVVAWGLTAPFVPFHLMGLSRKVLGIELFGKPQAFTLACLLINYLVTFVLLGAMTKSWLAVTAGVMASTVAALCCLYPTTPPSGDIWPTVRWGWYAMLAGTLMWWSIRARRRVFGPGRCVSCGYDLAGLTAPLCPECGLGVGASGEAP